VVLDRLGQVPQRLMCVPECAVDKRCDGLHLDLAVSFHLFLPLLAPSWRLRTYGPRYTKTSVNCHIRQVPKVGTDLVQLSWRLKMQARWVTHRSLLTM
jgi:hypothetical protein